MSAAAFDREWGDDLMAIADAPRETPLPHPELGARFIAHPSMREEFTDLALELRLLAWAEEVPADHTTCDACSETLCGCDVQCEALQRDACGHYGQPYCASCAPYNCADCRDEMKRFE